MSHAALASIIDAAWEKRTEIGASTKGEIRDSVEQALALLDSGQARVAERDGAGWKVNQWL